MSTQTFLLPDVGEGLTEAEIVSWRVAPGDPVAVNDVLVEIETAKSLVELPSPFAGVVGDLLAAEGDTVNVGAAIITIAERRRVGAAGDRRSERARRAARARSATGEGAVLVGYGSAGPRAVAAAQAGCGDQRGDGRSRRSASSAKPPIRKLARDLGVDLTHVVPSGPAGEVTREDVMKHASQASVFRNIETPEWGDVREETIPVAVPDAAASAPPALRAAPRAGRRSRGVDPRARACARRRPARWPAAPTPRRTCRCGSTSTRSRTMELVKRLKTSPDFADVKVSPLLIMARAVIWAVRRTPMVNAAWLDSDEGAQIRVRHYVNLGIAAATPRGLLVPNIKDAQDLNTRELARALEKLTLTAREGKTTPADQQGGTITITNIGVFGVDAGTPIINPGEVGHRRARRDSPEALGRRRRGSPAVGDDRVGLVRSPRGRWRRRVAVHRRHRLGARRAGTAAGLTAARSARHREYDRGHGLRGLRSRRTGVLPRARGGQHQGVVGGEPGSVQRSVRGPFEALAAELEPEFGDIKIFRPYRDVRFSADKTPYKLHIGMVSRAPVAHYLQLSDSGVLLGGGVYDVPPAALARFREIVDDPRLSAELEGVLNDVRAQGFALMSADALRTAPRGYSIDHPRIDLLRLRRLAVGREDELEEWMWTPDAFDIVSDAWRTVSTWCRWVSENLGRSPDPQGQVRHRLSAPSAERSSPWRPRVKSWARSPACVALAGFRQQV